MLSQPNQFIQLRQAHLVRAGVFALLVIAGLLEPYCLPPWRIWLFSFIYASAIYALVTFEPTLRYRVLGWFLLTLINFVGTFDWIYSAALRFFRFGPIPTVFIAMGAFASISIHLLFLIVFTYALQKRRLFKKFEFVSFAVYYAFSEWLLHDFRVFSPRLGHYLQSWPAAFQLLSLGGVSVGTFFVCLLSTAVVRLIATRRSWIAVFAVVALALLFTQAYGESRLEKIARELKSAPSSSIGWVNTDFPAFREPTQNQTQIREAVLEQLKRMDAANHRLAAQGSRLIVWPESASPLIVDTTKGQLDPVGQFVDFTPAPLLMGFIERRGSSIYGSAIVLETSRNHYDVDKDVYRKTRLIPFAEERPPTYSQANAATYRHSDDQAHLLFSKELNLKIGISICYEALFSEQSRRQIENGADLLINIANDSWFSGTAEVLQHAYLALALPVATGRTFLRVANQGVSELVLPDGREQMISQPGIWKEQAAKVPIVKVDSLFNQFGETWLIVATLACLIVAFARTRLKS